MDEQDGGVGGFGKTSRPWGSRDMTWSFPGLFSIFCLKLENLEVVRCAMCFGLAGLGAHAFTEPHDHATSCLQSPLLSPPAAALTPKATAGAFAAAALSLLRDSCWRVVKQPQPFVLEPATPGFVGSTRST